VAHPEKSNNQVVRDVETTRVILVWFQVGSEVMHIHS
jgi:hypothetical protein